MSKLPFSTVKPPREVFVLLPCHTLDDFPTHSDRDKANGLLLGWTVNWHPAMIAHTQKMPCWHRADTPPDELVGCIVILPEASESNLPTGTIERANQAVGCQLIRVGKQSRQEIASEILGDELAATPAAADFYALAYAYLQVQLMTRQLRYSSNLDEAYFAEQVVAAANAWSERNDEPMKEALHNCFDLLAQERDHSFSADPYLIDLTLLAETTLGDDFAGELELDQPMNILASADLIEKLRHQNRSLFDLLCQEVKDGRCGIAGGLSDDGAELESPSCAEAIASLIASRGRYVEMLGAPPHAFARFGGGLPSDLPVFLSQIGYDGAIYADFVGGSDLGQDEAKLLWQAGDSEVQAICATPLDASDPQVFLGLGPRLGEAVDAGQVATALLVHWPGSVCFAYQDLRRASKWGLALGKFQTLGDYFTESERPYHSFQPSSPSAAGQWLSKQIADDATDVLSRSAKTICDHVRQEVANNLAAMHSALSGDQHGSDVELHALASKMVVALGGEEASGSQTIVNPHGSAARKHLGIEGFPPAKGGHIYGGHSTPSGNVAIVDVPACGFASVTPGAAEPKRKWFARPKHLVNENTLRNEFFEVAIHPDTGGILSVHSPDTRANRFSLQLAHSDSNTEAASSMQLDDLETLRNDTSTGEIECKGKILSSAERVVAEYSIRYRLELGSRFVHTHIKLDPKIEMSTNPWRSYFATRIAWAMEASAVRVINRDQMRTTSDRQLTASQGIFVDSADSSTLVLASGLPSHRLVGRRMLDTLLVVKGESNREFEVSFGFDVKNPVAASRLAMAPVAVVKDRKVPNKHGWLFHVDSPTVITSGWSSRKNEDGQTVVKMIVVETAGKSSRARIRTFGSVVSARTVDFLGNHLKEVQSTKDHAELTLAGHEIVMLELVLSA